MAGAPVNILIINLAQSSDRLQAQKMQFAKLGLSFDRLPAVQVEDIDDKDHHNAQQKAPRLLKKSELACLYSHKTAWQKVASSDEPWLILEDDAVLACDIAQVLNAIKSHPTNADLINLEAHARQKIVGQGVFLVGEYALLPLLLDKSGTAGYVLYPSGAKKLLDHLKKRTALADGFIYHCPKLIKYQLEPAAVIQSDRCAYYNIPFDAYPLKSLIGTLSVKNPATSKTPLWRLKTNRLKEQLKLGTTALTAHTKGKKRFIYVDSKKFI